MKCRKTNNENEAESLSPNQVEQDQIWEQASIRETEFENEVYQVRG